MSHTRAMHRVQITKYALVGVINTLVATFIIFAAQLAHAWPVFANFIGYAVGIGLSFTLKSKYTFRVRADRYNAVRFLVVTGASYLANLAVVLCVIHLSQASYVAQLAGIVTYTVVGFIGNKYWAMRTKNHAAGPQDAI